MDALYKTCPDMLMVVPYELPWLKGQRSNFTVGTCTIVTVLPYLVRIMRLASTVIETSNFKIINIKLH